MARGLDRPTGPIAIVRGVHTEMAAVRFVESTPDQTTALGRSNVTTIALEEPDTPASFAARPVHAKGVADTRDTAWTDELIGPTAGLWRYSEG